MTGIVQDFRYAARGPAKNPGFTTVAVLTLAAALALVLSALAVYGVMAHLTTVRTREIGIRIASGATFADIVALIVGHTMSVSALLAGVSISASAIPFMRAARIGSLPFR